MSLQKLRDAIASFDALSVRERVLILVTVVVAIALPMLMYAIEPAQKEQAKLGVLVAKMKAENATQVLELATLKAQNQKDPNALLQEQITQLQQQIAALNARLQSRAERLITPQQMLGMLEQVLNSQRQLQLISLAKGEPVRFQPPGQPQPTPTQGEGIYRHDLELVVEGGFFEVLAYLQALEQLPKSFFWDGLDYQVETYPRARVTLRVHTLSTAEGWLGV